MKNWLTMLLVMVVGLSVARTGWSFSVLNPTPPPADAFQVGYLSNLDVGDGVVNVTNAGTRSGVDPAGNICANVYVFDPDEAMLACCACAVTPNALNSFSAKGDLIKNPLTPATPPTSVVVKLLATNPTNGACDASFPATAKLLAPGLRAWSTTLHALPTSPVTYGVTESEFSQAVLSASERAKLVNGCASILAIGGGSGVCHSCRLGGQ